MAVRFYVDADALGLAHVLVRARSDVTYPGDPGGRSRDGTTRPACPITTPRTDDPVWLAMVATAGWVAITKDKKVKKRPAEIAAIKTHGVRVVQLSGATASTVWGQLTIVTRHWEAIEDLTLRSGPIIVRATHRSFTYVLGQP